MVVKSRILVAMGLALAGASAFPTLALAQGADGSVRKAAAPAPAPRSGAAPAQSAGAPAAQPARANPVVVGTVDIEAVFKGYDKVKTQQEEFKAAAMAKHNELMKLQTEAQEQAQMLAKMTPGSVDAKKIEDRMTQLKAQLEAGRESAQRDFALRESEMLAALYKEVQDIVAQIAEIKGMNYVIQVSNEPVSGTNPNSVMAAMAKTVVFADQRNDITKDVVHNLNRRYAAAGGKAPSSASSAPKPATPAGN